MDRHPPLMSTPIKGRYSSFFKELAQLPSILFGHYSRDTCDLKKDTPNKSFLSSLNGSPCRHSPRLLSNGYYTMGEDSFNSEDEGEISFSPTVCRVSYKENIVRIFKRRRRPHAQRALDLSNYDSQDGWRPQLGEDFTDCEPFDFHQMSSNYSKTASLCTSGSITIMPDPLTNVSSFLHSGPWDQRNNEQLISESSWVTGNDSRTCSEDTSKVFLEQKQKLNGGTSAQLGQSGILEEVSKEQLNLEERPFILLSQIGSLQEASGEDSSRATQKKKEKDVSIAVLYICVLMFLVLLSARFWTGVILSALCAVLISFTITLFLLPRCGHNTSLEKKVT